MTAICRFEQQQTKVCFKCNTDLPLASFYKHPQMKDGRVNKCKKCNRADVTNNRHKNVERYREYDRERYQTPNRKAAMNEFAKRYSRKNSIKRKTHFAVNNAVRGGRLIKPLECSECGKQSTIQGHHDDYRKPLEVRWLCAVCHSAWHQQNGEGLQ
jgi:ribosomal protein S27AE